MEEQQRDVSFGDGRKMQMSIPERIVLSAGYDGNDNEDTSPRPFNPTSNFDETPVVNPDHVLAGMKTPPSVLTIDHSSDPFKNNSPNWHTEGDGADDDETQSSFKRYSQQFLGENNDDDEDDTDVIHQERSVIIAGQEDSYALSRHVPYDDPMAMRKWYTSMQRRITLLENQLDYQNRVSNVWKYFLLTMSVINPIIINYFFSRRR